jgi:AraC family transcriptional regulator
MSMIEQSSFGSSLAVDALLAERCGAIKQRPGPTKSQSDISVVIAQTSSGRVDVHKSLTVKSAQDDLIITHMMRTRPGHGMTEPQAKRAAYAACVHLDEFSGYDVWCDEKHDSSLALASGALHINDMRHSWLADIRSAFQVVNFYIPQSALDDITDDQGAPRIEELHCPMSSAKVDAVVKNLALALLPALIRPDQTNRLFVDHAWRAVTAHLARTYGTLRTSPLPGRGGLAPWQERRAKEMLTADLSGSLSLPELASACRLSCSHFSQAFRQTVGCPPHQWLLAQRVERSKQLILNTKQSLSDIALATGFADQSHFTRVFSQRVKASPAAWRRAQGR